MSSALLHKVHLPLDPFGVGADGYHAVGDFTGEPEHSRAFGGDVDGDRVLDPLGVGFGPLVFTLLAGHELPDEVHRLAHLLDGRNAADHGLEGAADSQTDEGSAPGELVDAGGGVGNGHRVEEDGGGHAVTYEDAPGVQRGHGHQGMDVPTDKGHVDKGQLFEAALLRDSGVVANLLGRLGAAESNAKVQFHCCLRRSRSHLNKGD